MPDNQAAIGDVAVIEMRYTNKVYRVNLTTQEQCDMYNRELAGEPGWSLEKKGGEDE